MDIIIAAIVFLVGIAFLYKCSDWLVDGASKTAAFLRVSPLIIGVVVVAFGTSAPEFAISVGAAVGGKADISLGNVVGSCVANILLVLGVAAIIRPIKIKKSIVGREMPMLLGSTVLLLVFSLTGLLDDYHLIGGVIFIVLFLAFIIYFIRKAREEREKKATVDAGDVRRDVAFLVVGIVGVVIGAYLLIESSVTIAEFFGVPMFVIALSIVAIGTSLPELVVSAMAAYKGEEDIAVGNVLGSNIFNILLVLGFSALFIPLDAAANLTVILFLLVVTVLMFPLLWRGYDITRWEGVLLLIGYVVFNYYIFFL